MNTPCPATVARASATIMTSKLSFIFNLLAPVCQPPLAKASPQTRPPAFKPPRALDEHALPRHRGQGQRYHHDQQTELHLQPPGTSVPAPSRQSLAANVRTSPNRKERPFGRSWSVCCYRPRRASAGLESGDRSPRTPGSPLPPHPPTRSPRTSGSRRLPPPSDRPGCSCS